MVRALRYGGGMAAQYRAAAPPGAALKEIEEALQSGAASAALARLKALDTGAEDDPVLLQRIAQLYTHLNLHREAERCHRRAVQLAPANEQYLYNLATSAIALGNLEEAESLLDRVIARAPQDFDAYYNRATLRRQTQARNHVAEIESALAQPKPHPKAEVQLAYALAKELEDLGEYPRSFAALKRGADARRRLLSYGVDADIRAMAEIRTTFDRAFFDRAIEGASGPRPIFVLGLPRSGTTLVDRILSAHSRVESLGEIANFAAALMRAAPQAKDKFELIRKSAAVDFRALGQTYLDTTAAIASGRDRAIDKTPVNFLYLGLIARALPDATIVHVRRGAMDVCYAMYKTLFRAAYPFTYDLGDLAQYYLGYRGLMAHWREMLPDRFLEVDYEDLVANQESVTRQLLSHCDLAWEESCLAFERNDAPSLTASAAQVREPIHARSVGLWRRYPDQLEPLARRLRNAGIDLERE